MGRTVSIQDAIISKYVIRRVFMNNKNTVIRQCEYLNAPRRVKFGRATSDEFFSRVSGNLLVTGK